MIKIGVARKLTAIVANFSLLFNSIMPFLVAIPPTYAQEATPTEVAQIVPTPEPQPVVVAESTPAPEAVATPEAPVTPEPTIEITPTLEPTAPPEITPTVDLIPTVTPINSEVGSVTPSLEATPVPTDTPVVTPNIEKVCLTDQSIKDTVAEDWTIDTTNNIAETKNKVAIGVRYVFPSDNKVSVTFKCLPADESQRTTLKIQQVKSSDLKLPDTIGDVAEFAYDITTSMTDGTFEYDVTLPKKSDQTAEVSYIEKTLDDAKNNEIKINEIKPVEESKVEQQSDVVKAVSLDHFTIFIIVDPDETVTDNNVENKDNAWVSDDNYAVFNNSSDSAEYGFPNLNIPTGSTIEGIEVIVEGKTTGRNFDVSIFNKSNSNPDTFTSFKTTTLNSTETTISLGGSTEKWGKTWTSNDFDNSFRVLVDATSGGGNASLDLIQVKVYYTEPAPPLTPPTFVVNPSDDYALTSVTGVWTQTTGGSNITGLNTNEVRWGNSTGFGQSGLRFDGSGAQSFNQGNNFYLGMLTHLNWPITNAASGAKLKITLAFSKPGVTPNPEFTYDFIIDETPNTPPCAYGGNCNDKITFPTSYGSHVFTIGDIQYTLVIDGFVNAYPGGSPVSQFITEEQKNNSAFLVGHLSSELVPAPAINIEKKTNNIDVTASPGPDLNTGDIVTWQYIVQNTGNVNLTNIAVIDDKVGTITCPSTSLPASAIPSERVMTCTASGTVTAGQYANTATVTASHASGTVGDSDSSWYNGLMQKGSILAHKFHDKNQDGVKNGADTNYTFGLTVELYTGDNCQGTRFAFGNTDGSGNYTFPNLVVGNYSVKEIVPTGWKNSTSVCQNVTVTSNNQSLVNFGNYRLGSITIGKDTDPDQDCCSRDIFNYTGSFNGEFYDGDTDTFNNLPIGQYTITESPKSGWMLTGIDCSDNAGVIKDIANRTVTINLVAGNNISCTFNNQKLGRIEGYKFNDKNANRHRDGGEEKLSGWTITLDKNRDGSIDASTTTDSNGNYQFTNLTPGWYRVCEVPQTDWYSTLSAGAICRDTEIHSNGGDVDELVFANRKLGSITVCKVITDTNGNIVNGSAVPGSTFTIDWDRGLNDTVFSSGYTANTDMFADVAGDDAYCIPYTKLPINSYHYSQESINSSLSVWTTPKYNDQYQSSVNNLSDFYIYGSNTDSNGEIDLANDAGVHRTLVVLNQYKFGSISGQKFNDSNGNGQKDNGELGIANWTINLDKSADGSVDSTTVTDSDGNYVFNQLESATYRIRESGQDGWTQMTPDPSDIVLNIGDNVSDINFGNTLLGTVNVIKYHDLNANGVQDDGEPTLPDWNIILGAQSSQTDSSGKATFKVVTGNYDLSETILPGWYQSAITCEEDSGEGVLITAPGEAYGHHGNCYGWNGCGDAATCALWACKANGYSNLVSYGESRSCLEFNDCNLFNSRGSVDMNWRIHCGVMGVTDIKCSNGSNPSATPAPDGIGLSLLVKPAYAQISDSGDSKSIFVEAGSTKTCRIGNYQKASITVNKDVLSYLGGEIDDNFSFNLLPKHLDSSVTFSEDSPAVFAVKPGTYQFSEVDIDSKYVLKSDNDVEVTVQSGDSKSITFKNWKVQPELTIAKFNNRWPNTQSIGSEVEYTIILNVLKNNLKDVTVTDLPPLGFIYKPGSYQVLVNGISRSIPEPIYSSPGKWYVGDLTKDDVVTLSYIATIDSSVDPGLYKDAAWAYGCAESETCNLDSTDKLLASSVDSGKSDSGILTSIFVGTKIKLDPVFASSDVNIVREEGQVLGATTELPYTGSATIWLLVFGLLSTLGVGSIIYGSKSNRKNTMKHLFIFTLIGLASLFSVNTVQAVQSSNIFISVENPISPTNKDWFDLSFTTLDILNRPLTVKCFKVNPDWSEVQIGADINVKAGGNSGKCSLENYRLTDSEKTYYFYAIASADGESYRSDSVPVDFDTSGPGTPNDYKKEKIGNCRYDISFKASNDGKTNIVRIYRADITKFIADTGSQIGQVGISPDQKGSFADLNLPDCNKTYYYVIRAFDEAGNGSGLAGDFYTVYVSTTQTSTSTTGAIPVIGSDIPEDKSADVTVTPTATPTDVGSILGSKINDLKNNALPQFKSFISRHKFASAVVAILLLAIIGYGLKKFPAKKKRRQ